uniref:Uncharacterized protein n=1 Tax=Mycena chlorophos TaxID=658473 RepID=A0ABQ0LPV0_MYCCL|nr:predicted protein [Mycena chlorophos]
MPAPYSVSTSTTAQSIQRACPSSSSSSPPDLEGERGIFFPKQTATTSAVVKLGQALPARVQGRPHLQEPTPAGNDRGSRGRQQCICHPWIAVVCFYIQLDTQAGNSRRLDRVSLARTRQAHRPTSNDGFEFGVRPTQQLLVSCPHFDKDAIITPNLLELIRLHTMRYAQE